MQRFAHHGLSQAYSKEKEKLTCLPVLSPPLICPLFGSPSPHLLFPHRSFVPPSAVLPKLLPQAMSADLYTRHGAVLAVAELSHALHKQSAQNGRYCTHMQHVASVTA